MELPITIFLFVIVTSPSLSTIILLLIFALPLSDKSSLTDKPPLIERSSVTTKVYSLTVVFIVFVFWIWLTSSFP